LIALSGITISVDFIQHHTNLLIETKDASDDGTIVALNGAYGSGKTTFIKKWEEYINKEKASAFTINTWENDLIDTPMESMIYEFMRNITGTFAHKVKKVAKTVLKITSGIELPTTTKHQALLEFQDAIRKYAESLDKPLFIFIDELDRCRPDYAIKYLEAIKHIFAIHQNVIFIVAVDMKQLENSAKHMFGENLDCNAYFLRFFTDRYNLPSDNDTYYPLIYEEVCDVKVTPENNVRLYDKGKKIATHLELTLREYKRSLIIIKNNKEFHTPKMIGRMILVKNYAWAEELKSTADDLTDVSKTMDAKGNLNHEHNKALVKYNKARANLEAIAKDLGEDYKTLYKEMMEFFTELNIV